MLQVAINNESVERYFKTEENIQAFLEEAASLELLSILDELKADALHQRSLKSIRKGEVEFYEDGKSLICTIHG